MPELSVITLAYNEEHNIAECLASVRWADEIIVVDSGSTDRTVELARQYTDRVLTVEWKGYGATKNLALQHARGEWILWLDADERVPDELACEIREAIRSNDGTIAGYSMPRRAYFLGRWVKHCGWYPGYVTRLFRRDSARFSNVRVHERLEIDGTTGRLKNDLIHYTDRNLFHYFEKFNRYTSLAVEDFWSSGKKFSLYDLLVRPPFTFFRMYLLRQGYLDGLHGFILCVLSAVYVFVKYAKLWEKGNNPDKQA